MGNPKTTFKKDFSELRKNRARRFADPVPETRQKLACTKRERKLTKRKIARKKHVAMKKTSEKQTCCSKASLE